MRDDHTMDSLRYVMLAPKIIVPTWKHPLKRLRHEWRKFLDWWAWRNEGMEED